MSNTNEPTDAMTNGTEKQIAWAAEIKAAAIAKFSNSSAPYGPGGDASMRAIISSAAADGMGRNDREQYRARVAAYDSVTPEQLRAEIIRRATECNDAQWWIEHRDTMGNEFAFPFLKEICA